TEGGLRYLIAAGCLSQLHGQELLDELPELDAVVGVAHFTDMVSIVEAVERGERVCRGGPAPVMFTEKGPRVVSTPPGSAYLKIADGCDNRCSYCAIPDIRGRLRSRPVQELYQEAAELVKKHGIRELTVIAQDSARYGHDLGGQDLLPELLAALDAVDGLEWVRLMYLHPAHMNDAIIEAIAASAKTVAYLDIPIQHASDRILNSMNRRHDRAAMARLFAHLRSAIPDVALRTTVMVGFPGETDDDFRILCDFIAETQFDWLGAFVYNPQQNTPAAALSGAVPDDVKAMRLDTVMQMQREITRQRNLTRVGRSEKILVSSRISRNLYSGRSCFQAPEVDGLSLVRTPRQLKTGEFVEVVYEALRDYDLIGDLVE
ncbi:MAG: 30S ribosomal protein S12 methylthiotransferase RimO, partial [Syntrophomonadaceae bacterium]|nr:30S ribosomal protein S12 methylthiotransferase RimO [Syntrophomonadaceae bacterium]